MSDEADAVSPGCGLVLLAVAVAGFRSSLWLAVIALAGHWALDSEHGALIANPGVPPWWPPFCLSYDVADRRVSRVAHRERPRAGLLLKACCDGGATCLNR